jgi:zinc transporter
VKHPNPICAFAVSAEGVCKPISSEQPIKLAPPSTGYSWFHFDLNDPAFESWVKSALPLMVANALIQSETRPRCDQIEDGLILNLRGVNLNPGADPDDMVSIRLWVREGLIVSTRVRKVWAMDTIRLQMETGKGPTSVTAFLAELTNGLTKRIEKVSVGLVEDTDKLEEDALDPDRALTSELASLRQSIIKLRRFVRPQSEAIADLASRKAWALDTHDANLLSETANRTTRTMEELDATSDRLQAIQDHLDMLHASALGRNSYVLSVVAAIFLPLGFLTGLFGINVGGMPLVDANYGFLLVTGGSALLGIVLFMVFRHLKWL